MNAPHTKYFTSVFSYTMTFWSFFKVVDETEKTITLQEVVGAVVPGTDGFTPQKVPTDTEVKPSRNGEPTRFRVPKSTFRHKGRRFSEYLPDRKYIENHLD